MKLHANARTCPNSRRLIVERVGVGWSLAQAAEAAGVSERTVAKWLARWRAEGEAGLVDRSSAPLRIPHRTSRRRVEAIVALRRLRMTAAEIAEVLSMALSTVSAVLRRVGLGKRSRLEPPEPPNRYEHRRPGGLLHLDVKKLGRIHGAATASPGIAAARTSAAVAAAPASSAGSSCTSASTTRPGSPTPRCWQTNAALPPRPSSSERSAGFGTWASSRAGC
jgi:transposase